MNKKYFREVLLVMAGVVMLFYLILFATSVHAEGGFSQGSHRVIYDGSKHDATVMVITFFVTPPLYRQDEGKHTLRIIRTGGELPSDRESVFF